MQMMSCKIHLACTIISLPNEFWWAVSWPARSQLSCPLHIWLDVPAKLRYLSLCEDFSGYTLSHTKATGLPQNSYCQTTFLMTNDKTVSITVAMKIEYSEFLRSRLLFKILNMDFWILFKYLNFYSTNRKKCPINQKIGILFKWLI